MLFHSEFECKEHMENILNEKKKDPNIAPYISDMEKIFSLTEEKIEKDKQTNQIKRITGSYIYKTLIKAKKEAQTDIPLLIQIELFFIIYAAWKYMPIMTKHGYDKKIFDMTHLGRAGGR